MKSELIYTKHTVLPSGNAVVEIWYGGEFLATITGRDGPGIRVISKYTLQALDQSALLRERLEMVDVPPEARLYCVEVAVIP
jgi:hypothetical protein